MKNEDRDTYHVDTFEDALHKAQELLVHLECEPSQDHTHTVMRYYASCDTQIHKFENRLELYDDEYGWREIIYFDNEHKDDN